MILRDHPWQLKYTREDGDLVSRFYVPALSCAIRYDRTTGYFKAGSLALAARGIEHLALANGKMRLLVGCTLDEEEAEAIEKGMSAAELIKEKVALEPADAMSDHEKNALELLAWLIARGSLEVKVALPCDRRTRRPVAGTAIFHEKTGIIEDKTGDRLAFTGSLNETVQGWLDNNETLTIFTSFGPAAQYVDAEDRSFASYWADRAERTRVYDVPTAIKEDLLKFLPPHDDLPVRLQRDEKVEPTPLVESGDEHPSDQLEDRRAERDALWERIRTAARERAGGIWVGEATAPCEAWPHQRRAFLRMYGNSPEHRPKLLIADEVGLGKTVQAGLLIRQMWMAGRLRRGIILAPANVCAQWQSELREKFALNWPIYDGSVIRRYDPLTQTFVESPVARDAWSAEPYVIMSSHLARRRDRRPELLNADPYDLVILDEAHHARQKRTGNRVEANMLMRLMRELKNRTEGLILLSATPLQTNSLELYDLLALLGVPPEWDAPSYERYFEALSGAHLANENMEACARLFRATEAYYGQLPADRLARLGGQNGQPFSTIRTRRVAAALRGEASIPRRQLNLEDRQAAISIMKRWTPVSALMSRHTRSLLRRYQREGKLDARIASRRVHDRFVQMTPAERDIYERVETFIRNAYQNADEAQRNAVGFILTIYRKRLSSSFTALAKSLQGRLDRAEMEEAQFDLEDEGEETDIDEATASLAAANRLLESAQIDELLQAIAALPIDSKALQLKSELDRMHKEGFQQTMVFTGYTDTMDALRDWVADETKREVICFSGRGGEVRGADGRWRLVSRAEIKRRFKDGRGDILLCTDAAAEGLNFQFCGSLINYDMPWNPMRVEQRIGRIDRLGQRFDEIDIINLQYKDTVETQVYTALASRISLFENMVGGLQPILSAMSKEIGRLALSGAHVDVDAMIGTRIDETPRPSVDIDDQDALDDMPEMGVPAISLETLQSVLRNPELLPTGYAVRPLNDHDFAVDDPSSRQPVRATLSRSFYSEHFDHTEFWTPGALVFPAEGCPAT
jgi:ERCC4-related helicase